jgi:hypothetical protein
MPGERVIGTPDIVLVEYPDEVLVTGERGGEDDTGVLLEFKW